MFNIQRLKNADLKLLLSVLFLSIIGGLIVFSTTYPLNDDVSTLFYNQLSYYIIGFLLMFILATLNYQRLNKLYFIAGIYLFTMILLVVVLFRGVEINGAKRWIDIASFTVQPSEFAKLAVILLTAYIFAFKKQKLNNNSKVVHKNKFIEKLKISLSFLTSDYFIKLFLSGVLTLSIMFMVFLQKSLGNTILIAGIYSLCVISATPLKRQTFGYIFIFFLGLNAGFEIIAPKNFFHIMDTLNLTLIILSLFMIFLSGYVFKVNIILGIVIFIPLIFLYQGGSYVYQNKLQSYQKERIESFVNPSSEDNLSSSWNKRQSVIGVGSGRAFGKGFMKGTQVNFDFLPFAYTDFAYAAYAEQFGFMGTSILLLLYFVILSRISSYAEESEDIFGKILCTGVFGLIMLNMIQHIGMNLGKLPITGVPLPLISYGGSSLLTVFIGIGLASAVNNFEKLRTDKIFKLGKF